MSLLTYSTKPRGGVVHTLAEALDCISANASGHGIGGCIRTVHHIGRFTTPEPARCHERAVTEPYAHVCVSRAVAEELRLDRGIDARVIPNGVDAARFTAPPRETFSGAVEFAAGPGALARALDRALAHPDPERAERGRALARRYTWVAAARAHLAFHQGL